MTPCSSLLPQGTVEVLSMNRRLFVKLLGPVEDVLRSEAKKREAETLAATGVRATPLPTQTSAQSHCRPRCCQEAAYQNLSLGDFTVRRTLGVGAFGRVRLVEVRGLGRGRGQAPRVASRTSPSTVDVRSCPSTRARAR